MSEPSKEAIEAARGALVESGIEMPLYRERLETAIARAVDNARRVALEEAAALLDHRRHLNATGCFSLGDVCEFSYAIIALIDAKGDGNG